MKKKHMVYSVYLVIGTVLCVWGVLHLNELVRRTTLLDRQLSTLEEAVVAAPAVQPSATMAPEEPVPVGIARETSVSIPAPTPVAPAPATFIVPPGSDSLVPLEGWVDQPNRDRPGRVHTNLMIRRVSRTLKPEAPPRAPCLEEEQRPAERLKLSYGWVSLPARTILVPCGTR